jgi:hypothetical protein
MRFWIDTEFYENGRTIELISIGVVAEDARQYYAETPDALELANKTRWLSANVAPHLTQKILQDWQIAGSLISFMGEKPEIWGYFSAYDWVVVCQLFGTMMDLPKGWPMYCRDVRQSADLIGIDEIDVPQKNEHHALADAEWTRDAWLWLRKRGAEM